MSESNDTSEHAHTVVPSLAEHLRLVERVAELEERLEQATTWPVWLDRRQAASYLGMGVSTLEKRRDVPHSRIPGTGLIRYNRDALDLWLKGK